MTVGSASVLRRFVTRPRTLCLCGRTAEGASTSCPVGLGPAQWRQFADSAKDAPEGDAAGRPPKAARKPDAWKARLPPGVGRYGSKLLQSDPDKFERMRVILGYYEDVREGQLPTHITINNLQTLWLLNSIDPYYKLCLLSYRTKLLNQELVPPLAKTEDFLDGLAAQQSEFRPVMPGLGFTQTSSSSSSSNSSSSDSTSS